MFQLLTPTTAKLKSLTPRIEKHGDENVPAVSLGLSITGPNTLLDLFSETLRHALYKAAEDAGDNLPGIDAPTPLLRTRGLEKIKLKMPDMVGYRLVVDHGIGDDSAIDLHDCKFDKWALEPYEGGSVELSFRVGTSDIDETWAGRLAMKLGQEIEITIHAPEPKKDPIDGTQGHPGAKSRACPECGNEDCDTDVDGTRECLECGHTWRDEPMDAGDLFASQHSGKVAESVDA